MYGKSGFRTFQPCHLSEDVQVYLGCCIKSYMEVSFYCSIFITPEE